jgi:hypothetical protein
MELAFNELSRLTCLMQLLDYSRTYCTLANFIAFFADEVTNTLDNATGDTVCDAKPGTDDTACIGHSGMTKWKYLSNCLAMKPVIDTRNSKGRTPLPVTGFDNRLEAAELLIKHSSNLNATIYSRSRH